MPKTDPLLLMTRPRARAEGFVGRLQERGARFRVIYSPLIGIEVSGPLPSSDDLAGLVFTSVNGVSAWVQLDGRRDLPAYCVGDATAEAARNAGMSAKSAGGGADDLVTALRALAPQTPLLHLRGEHTRGDVARKLTDAGLPTREAVLYAQPSQPLSQEAQEALGGDQPVIAPLFSPRTAALLAEYDVKAPLLVAGMSQAVVKAAARLHIWKLEIATRPESDAMLDAVLELLEVSRESVEN